MPQPTLEAKNLEKHFNQRSSHASILQGINLKLLAGEAMGLLGPYHSGKSLLLNILAGKIEPSGGEVIGADDKEARVGHMPEQSIFPSVFTVKDIFSYHQQYCGNKNAAGSPLPSPKEWLEGTAIAGAWHKPITALGSVSQRWLSFYLASYGRPAAVLLDEPFRFFDDGDLAELSRKITELKADGTAIAIASHDLQKLREVCDEMVILCDGRIIHRAKKILPEQGRYFCLHVSGADQQTFDAIAKEYAQDLAEHQAAGQDSSPKDSAADKPESGTGAEPWQALFFEGFLAKVFFSAYADCYRMMEMLIAKGLVVVKLDTAAKPHLDNHNIRPHLQAGGSR